MDSELSWNNLEMNEIIVAGEPCLIIRNPMIPRMVICNSLLHPLLSRLKNPEEFVAFVSEPCVAPPSLDVVLVTAFWPRCLFNQASEEDASSRPAQIIRPQNLMLVESELYMKLTKKSCLFGDFIDSLLLHTEDKRKVYGILSKVRAMMRENKSYGLFFLTEVRGMEDVVDQATGIFEIVVKAKVETMNNKPLLSLTIIKHPDITEMDKKIEVVFEEGQPKRRRTLS